MKKILIIISIILLGCNNTAKYRVGDTFYVDSTKFTVTSVSEFAGSGGSYGGVNYECEYKDKIGVFHKKTVYEKQIK